MTSPTRFCAQRTVLGIPLIAHMAHYRVFACIWSPRAADLGTRASRARHRAQWPAPEVLHSPSAKAQPKGKRGI
jgi:hypothetical protein